MAAAIAYALHAPSLMPVESEPVVSEESVPEVNLATEPSAPSVAVESSEQPPLAP